ncbi:GGDEF domain-containing protein [Gracilibacillus marinus]|uniref:GGDEF domain-containing protein n=1 Tax=Gracilibacillus marinus TaxID=630535 RepID=A0ABV8VQH0_9BACI
MLEVSEEFTYGELKKMAFTDELTQLPNYRHFKYSFKQFIHKCQETESEFAIIFMDVDKFKTINDTYGHLIGDHILCQFAFRLQQVAREYHLHVYRKSGDEFLILVDDVSILLEMLRTIQSAFRRMFVVQNIPIYCNISMGYSVYPRHGTTEFDLIRVADKNMYANKSRDAIRS